MTESCRIWIRSTVQDLRFDSGILESEGTMHFRDFKRIRGRRDGRGYNLEEMETILLADAAGC